MIKNILLDLDDTVFDFHKGEKEALTETLVHFGIEPDDYVIKRYSEINAAQWKLLELGEIKRDEVKIRRFKFFLEELEISEIKPTEAASYYESRLGTKHFFMPDAEKILAEISDKYNVYIATNGYSSIQRSRIKSSGIEKYIKDVFISQEIGFDKPAPEYFEKAFAKIPNFKKEETVIAGDSLSSDIKGGKNAGIKTIWVNKSCESYGKITPDFHISSLSELPQLLKII